MAKITAPLLSFAGSGTIGSVMTFSRWKGIPYVRQRVIPANPDTTAQQATRTVFTAGNQFWLNAPALAVAPWNAFAIGQPLTGRNKFLSDYVRENRSQADLTNMIFSPGAKGGIPPVSIALTPGVGQMTVDFTNPTPPTGWTLDGAVAAAILDQDPAAPTEIKITADEDAAAPMDQVVLTGLTAGLTIVGAWLRWLKPDGSTAYSVSLTDSDTVT